MSTHFTRGILLLALAVLLMVFPFLVPSYYFTALLTQVLIFTIFTMGVNIVAGYTGLASLGHAGLLGAAAYTIALAPKFISQNLWLGMIAGILVASILAVFFALISLRVRGVNFIFITLGLGSVIWAVLFGWRSVTRGDDGITGIGNPALWPSFSLSGGMSYYYLTLVFFIISAFIIYRIIRSPFGNSIVGIRENEPRMRFLGYNVWLHKFIAFVISGAFSGVAGVLWAYYNGFVNPRYAGFEMSAEALLIVILGGSGTFFGPLVGTTIVIAIKNVVAIYTTRWLFVLGLTYIFTILLTPKGVVGALKGRLKR